MYKSFKFRLFPDTNQTRELEMCLETHRRLWNECLEWRQHAYDTLGITITGFDQIKWFSSTRIKNSYYARLNVNSAQQTIRNLDKAFAAFFRRLKANKKPGYPRFKSCLHFNSFTYIAGNGAKLVDGKLRLQKIGKIRVKLHREIEGKIKTVIVKREADKWFVIFACDLGEMKIEPSRNPAIGIDMGLLHFYTTSDGRHESNPRFLQQALPKLRRVQRALSRKKRGGSNRRKAVKRVTKLHTKVRNQRRDFHFKAARQLTTNYGKIAIESLDIQEMIESGRFSRSIQDAGWSQFFEFLRFKAKEAGVAIVAVDPRFTSQECSQCHKRVPKSLSIRTHRCSCGLTLDRDVNAAKNILARAFANGC